MKNLLILLFFVGCAVHVPKRNIPETKKPINEVTPQRVIKSSNENIRECLDSLMSTHGVAPTESFTICTKIYRRDNSND